MPKSKLVWRVKQPPPPPPPPWVELPGEITADILQRLGAVEILENAQKVCSTWQKVCHEYPSMWRVIDIRNKRFSYNESLGKKCRVAVDRSQGQLVKINIEGFGDDELLHYIAQRSSQLRHLRLVACYDLSGEGLVAAAKNLPLLEELHIYFADDISNVDIESVGRACTHLRSFTLNHSFRGSLGGLNEHALAIAGNMPELRHLSLFSCRLLNDDGLCAILDGCPRLESLDLRQCYNVDLQGDIGRRCRQQIVDLKCPNDSTCDYEYTARIDDFDDFDYDYAYDDLDYEDFTNPFSEYID